jgi:hypothetical protein
MVTISLGVGRTTLAFFQKAALGGVGAKGAGGVVYVPQGLKPSFEKEILSQRWKRCATQNLMVSARLKPRPFKAFIRGAEAPLFHSLLQRAHVREEFAVGFGFA